MDAELAKEKGEPNTNNKNNNNNNNNNTNNNKTNNYNNNTNNNNNNNKDDNDNNKNSRESSLRSLDLDKENPESNLSGSEPDLDASSLGVESDLGSSDRQALSLENLGHPTLAVESSLASLDQHAEQESSESFDQEGEIGTEWDPSLAAWVSGSERDSFGTTKPKKRVTFEEGTSAYNKLSPNNRKEQTNRRQHSSQLEQLEQNKKKNKKNRKSKTTHQEQKAWQEGPSTMQQQPATASREEQDELRPNNTNSLDGEELSLGSLESQTQATTNLLACISPKHNNNSSILGQDLKNKAAWGIMIDTGAAISLAPVSFAPTTELSPLESTFQLRSVTGNLIKAYGRRTVDLRGSQLSFKVSFVIADVQQALLGMDIFMQEQLSLQRGSTNEHWLVNNLGERTQLQQRGHHLFLEACPCDSGLISYMRSSFQEENGSLLDDKNSAQDAASEESL